MVESSALLKRRTSKGYRGFESLPHRGSSEVREIKKRAHFRIPSGSVIPSSPGLQTSNNSLELLFEFVLPTPAPSGKTKSRHAVKRDG